MAAAGAYELLSRGLLAHLTASCASPAAALGGRWGLWAAWRAGEALACYTLSIGDALMGLGVLLAAPWLVYRSGLLRCLCGGSNGGAGARWGWAVWSLDLHGLLPGADVAAAWKAAWPDAGGLFLPFPHTPAVTTTLCLSASSS